MHDIQQLKSAILADGKIDAVEVATLREVIFADGQIDRSEAELLFELNNKCSNVDNDPAWVVLFVEAISSFLLDDRTSPGEIDMGEAVWLIEQIQVDGKLDSTKKALLKNLSEKAKAMTANLTEFIKTNL